MAAIVLGQLPNLIFNNSYMRERNRARREMPKRPGASSRNDPTGRSESSARGNATEPTDPAAAARELGWVGDPSLTRGVLLIHQYLPLAWVSYGAMTLRQGHAWPAVWGSALPWALESKRV